MALFSLVTKRYPFAVIAFAAAVMLSFPAHAQKQPATKTLEVMGTSSIYGENIAAARNQAISGSLDTAVRLVTVGELPHESLLNNFQLINKTLYKNTDKFIQDYRVLTETKSGKVYNVLVRATVSLASLEEHFSGAGIIFGRRALPKILFLIAEKNIQDILPQYWWGQADAFFKGFAESAMAETMNQKGFTIIDPIFRALNQEIGSELNKPDLTNQEAIELGRRLQADVVIIGRSIVHQAPNIMNGGIRSYQGMVTVRSIQSETGAEIASSMQTAVTANANEIVGGRDALSNAGTLSGNELASLIAAVWQREVNKPTLVEITIEGTSNLVYFEKFRGTLTDLAGVKGLQIKEMKPDEMILIVDYEGNTEKLAAALILKIFDTFGINISEISLNHLRIRLNPR